MGGAGWAVAPTEGWKFFLNTAFTNLTNIKQLKISRYKRHFAKSQTMDIVVERPEYLDFIKNNIQYMSNLYRCCY